MANITMIFDRRIYIIPTDPDSDIMPHCPDNSNTTRCTTLIDLNKSMVQVQFNSEKKLCFDQVCTLCMK